MEMDISKDTINIFIDNFYESKLINEGDYIDDVYKLYYIHRYIFNEVLAKLNKAVKEEVDSLSALKKYLEYLNQVAKENAKAVMLINNNMKISMSIINEEKIKTLKYLDSSISKNQIELIDRCIKDGYINDTNSRLISMILKKIFIELANEYITNCLENPKEKMDKFLFTFLTLKV